MRFHAALAGIAAVSAAFSGFVSAQDLFICSRSDQIFTRSRDLNANGNANDIGEFGKVAFNTTLLKEGREVKATSTFGAHGFVWLDQNTKNVTKLVDTNNDGVFQPAEISSVFNFPASSGVTTANTFLIGLGEMSNGDFYIANNAFKTLPTPPPPTNGLYRVKGMNGSVPLAVTPALQQSDVVTAFESNSLPGAAVINAGAFERLASHKASGTIYGYNTLDDCIYALRDLDGDGKFTTPGEVVNFLNGSGHKAGLGVSADMFGGALSIYGALLASATPAPTTGNWTVLNAVEVDQSSGTVWVATTTLFFTLTPRSVVFKCQDLNGNGTCNDPGEVTMWCDDFASGTFESSPGSGIFYPPTGTAPGYTGMGIDPATGDVFVCHNNGPKDQSGPFTCDTVWRLVDKNADGDAADPGEQELVAIQKPAGSFSLELEVTSNGFFKAPFAAATNFETPGTQNPISTPCGGSFNFLPGIRFYAGPPYVGNSTFQVSVTGTSVGSTFGQLWFSLADWDPISTGAVFTFLGFPLPANPLSRNLDEWFSFLGVWGPNSPSYIDMLDLLGTGTQFFNSPTAAVGDPNNSTCGSPAVNAVGRFDFTVPIPNLPGLVGSNVNVRFQWHTQDALTGQRVVSDLGVATIN